MGIRRETGVTNGHVDTENSCVRKILHGLPQVGTLLVLDKQRITKQDYIHQDMICTVNAEDVSPCQL